MSGMLWLQSEKSPHIVLEAGVVAQQHDAGVWPQPLEVSCVGTVPAHQNHCRHLHGHHSMLHVPGDYWAS